MSNARLRLGVIGAGRIAQAAHLPALVKARNIELVAISDPSVYLAESVARRYGLAGFTETSDLLAAEIDAVLIATPDRFHFPLAQQAMVAGKHVLVEKPLASTSEQAQTLVNQARAAGLRLQTGAMKRHDPGIAFAKLHLPRIGRIISFTSWYRVMSLLRAETEATLFPDTFIDPDVRAVENSLKAEREAHLLPTHGAHLFDGLGFFGGAPRWVSAHVGNVGDDYTWHGVAAMRDSDGLISFNLTASVHGDWAEGTDIYGEFGHIRTRTHFPFFKRASDVEVNIESDRVSLVPHFGDTDPYKLQAEHFASTVLEGAAENPSPEDGVLAVRWIEAVRDSSHAGGARVAL
jgi:predicted dehydrogenase